MNPTLKKFGYPDRLIMESEHWAVVLRPQQATLGALVLGARSDAKAFSALPGEAFTDLHQVCGAIETALSDAFGYSQINYLMLMMVDPEVHFHVLPRYDSERGFGSRRFTDPGWPGPPDLAAGETVDDALAEALIERIRDNLPA